MADIATREELASALQSDLDTATANLLLLGLAQGLVQDEIGERDPWPAVAKATALAAAARAYVNPTGARTTARGPFSTTFASAEAGVYLTDGELARLRAWLIRHGGDSSTEAARPKVGTIRLGIPGIGSAVPR